MLMRALNRRKLLSLTVESAVVPEIPWRSSRAVAGDIAALRRLWLRALEEEEARSMMMIYYFSVA